LKIILAHIKKKTNVHVNNVSNFYIMVILHCFAMYKFCTISNII